MPCQCPTCDNINLASEQMVCGSDTKKYPSRCHLRSTSCSTNIEIFEVPCVDIDPDDVVGSGDDCDFGGEQDERLAMYGDDEEFGGQCTCDWHCRSNGSPKFAEGKSYDTLCHLYRDGICQLQRKISIEFSFCECNHPGVLDAEFCGLDGGCLCRPRFVGLNCDSCVQHHFRSGDECIPCGCSAAGSYDKSCRPDGTCKCKEGYTGEKCEIEIPIEDCETCSADQLNSKIQCANNYRIYSSLCAMHMLHCRQQKSDRPTAIEFYEPGLLYECFTSIPEVVTIPLTTTEATTIQEVTVITTATTEILTTPNVMPVLTTARMDTTEGSADECDDDDLCEGGSGDEDEPTGKPAIIPPSSVVHPNMITYDVKLFLHSDQENHTGAHDEFIEILRKQFPEISKTVIFLFVKLFVSITKFCGILCNCQISY